MHDLYAHTATAVGPSLGVFVEALVRAVPVEPRALLGDATTRRRRPAAAARPSPQPFLVPPPKAVATRMPKTGSRPAEPKTGRATAKTLPIEYFMRYVPDESDIDFPAFDILEDFKTAKPLTFDEKRGLCDDIDALPPDKLAHVAKTVRESIH